MELNFTVTNQKIKYVSNLYIVEKSRNYLTAKFSFSGSEWKDVAKTAIFKKDDTVINVLLDESGRCQVPWEVITKGTLRVSVFGGDLVTVDTADVKILKSGYEEGNAPSEPTPDVYSQILAELQSIRTDSISEEALERILEDWLAKNEVDVLSKEEVEEIVQDYVDEHKDELKGVTFTPHISEGVLSWTNDGGLDNPQPVQLGGGGSPDATGLVPNTRTVADIDLTDDITAEELVAATRNVVGQMHVDFGESVETEVVLFEYMPYPRDASGNKLVGQKGQIYVSNGDGTFSWLTLGVAEGGAY